DTRKALGEERADLEAQRKQIIDRIGTLYSDTEAKASLEEIRTRLDALVDDGERAKLTAATRKKMAADRARLLGMAKDFAARARKLSGSALRDLLRPWLSGATFDKHARTITLTIRQ